jgi:four helix bundle protein
MPDIQSFEDLLAWKKGRDFSKIIHDMCVTDSLQKDHRLRNSLLRSSAAVMDHIADGFDRSWRCDFADSIDEARGALARCRSQLYRVFDRGYISEESFLDLLKANLEVSKELVALHDQVSEFHLDTSMFEPEEIYERM